MIRNVRRGDIYYADLNPVIGSEEGGERPVLILSNDLGNRYGTTVIAAPITSRKRNPDGAAKAGLYCERDSRNFTAWQKFHI